MDACEFRIGDKFGVHDKYEILKRLSDLELTKMIYN